MQMKKWILCLAVSGVIAGGVQAQENVKGQTYRLHEGITAYVNNPDGRDFTVGLDVRDINLYANGPREILFKVYDPDGQPVVREIIPDDGCASANLPDRIGGWDHELQSFINHYAKGTTPSFRWSAWSDPTRLQTLAARTFERPIKGGKKGVYRVVLAGTPDHYVTLRLSPALKYGVAGHPTFMHGHGDLLRKAYIYVPKGSVGFFMAVTEPDEPRARRFKLTAPDGTVLFEDAATGGFNSNEGNHWKPLSQAFAAPGKYDGKLLVLEVSSGTNDYLVKVTLQQARTNAFAEYVGMGSSAIFAPDEATANAIRGGTVVVDDLVFWHPFQVRFHEWLKKNPLNGDDKQKALRKELEAEFDGLRLLETSDGRGSAAWSNWAYDTGYYGCRIFRPGWQLMLRGDVPQEVKDLIKEGLIMVGDRLSFATNIEKVNGNAFAQINVALWYCHRATGDALHKERFEIFWQRWTTEGWGPGSGLSRSGDAQEHFAHDMHYGSYIMNNWAGGTWVASGILGDATDDPRFQKVMDRYYDLYSYLLCREQTGATVAANPWSARTYMTGSGGGRPWKGEPGHDFTVSVNGGNEWFAARRQGYYALTFHGRLAPEWMSECFQGQLGFGGGILCQFTVPGKGPVLASTLAASYGEGMHPSNWRNFHIHALVGERWDGAPVISGISEHANARLERNTVSSSGEIRGAHLKVARRYTFNPDSIDCAVKLDPSDYGRVMSIWSHDRLWSEMRLTYEMIPYLAKTPENKATTITTAEGTPLTAEGATTQKIRIDRGGFGVEIQLEQPKKVLLGSNSTVLIEVFTPGAKPVPASDVALNYRLVPFGQLVIRELAVPLLGPAKNLDAVGLGLAAQEPYAVQNGARAVAQMRFGIAGDRLALAADVEDPKPAQLDPAWKGSCLEVFGSMPGSLKIGQVFLVPAVDGAPAKAYRNEDGKQAPAPDIQVRSKPTGKGYQLEALIPLSLLAIDPAKDVCLLEFQVTATQSIDANGQRTLSHTTLFTSRLAYLDNFLYARVHLKKDPARPRPVVKK